MANRMIHTPSYLATADIPKYWTSFVSAMAVSGGWYVRGGSSASITMVFDSQSGWTIGFLFKYTSSSTNIVVQLRDGATLHCDLRFNQTTGVFFVTRNGTTIATGTTVLTQGADYYVEIQFVVADAPSGVAILKINGVTDTGINASNLDTRNAANASANTVTFLGSNSAGLQIKDIYINDNAGGVDDTFWGPIAVPTLVVQSDGTTTDWTPSASTNASNVDDATPDDDTTYNATSTNGHVDTFVMSDTGYASGTVKGVEWVADLRFDNATGTGRVAPVYRIGGTDYAGTDIVPTTTYLLVPERRRLSPATSSAWTVSELDGMEAGYKRTAA